MQILHECCDSQDDHFAKCNVECCAAERHAEQIQNNYNQSCDVNTDTLDEAEMLTQLEEIEKAWSDKNDKQHQTINDCLNHAHTSGLINTE